MRNIFFFLKKKILPYPKGDQRSHVCAQERKVVVVYIYKLRRGALGVWCCLLMKQLNRVSAVDFG
jgi:hypothetical protein